ncbi:MAG: PAS domain-containing protein [Spirochaetaceae bacterium]|nr:PAS domain-containing protein [Spirochaetaceae bacterium]
MAKPKNVLSPADRLILDSYKTTIDGLAAYYGEAFEIVLHDLTDLDHSVIKIANGFHSGRKEGAPITDLALSMLEEIRKNRAHADQDNQEVHPYNTYVSASKYGRPVRSTTIIIFGEKKKAIGLLCINLYLDSPISSLLQNFSLAVPGQFIMENFTSESDELIAKALEKATDDVTADETIPGSQRNKEIVTRLYYQGIFKLKNAVQAISADLGISKNTVYMHIRALEEKTG